MEVEIREIVYEIKCKTTEEAASVQQFLDKICTRKINLDEVPRKKLTTEKKTCKACFTKFLPGSNRQEFCSTKCRTAYFNNKRDGKLPADPVKEFKERVEQNHKPKPHQRNYVDLDEQDIPDDDGDDE